MTGGDERNEQSFMINPRRQGMYSVGYQQGSERGEELTLVVFMSISEQLPLTSPEASHPALSLLGSVGHELGFTAALLNGHLL